VVEWCEGLVLGSSGPNAAADEALLAAVEHAGGVGGWLDAGEVGTLVCAQIERACRARAGGAAVTDELPGPASPPGASVDVVEGEAAGSTLGTPVQSWSPTAGVLNRSGDFAAAGDSDVPVGREGKDALKEYYVEHSAVVRVGCELESPLAEAASLPGGATVWELERRQDRRGAERLRCAAGWLSVRAVDGTPLLRSMPAAPRAQAERLYAGITRVLENHGICATPEGCTVSEALQRAAQLQHEKHWGEAAAHYLHAVRLLPGGVDQLGLNPVEPEAEPGQEQEFAGAPQAVPSSPAASDAREQADAVSAHFNLGGCLRRLGEGVSALDVLDIAVSAASQLGGGQQRGDGLNGGVLNGGGMHAICRQWRAKIYREQLCSPESTADAADITDTAGAAGNHTDESSSSESSNSESSSDEEQGQSTAEAEEEVLPMAAPPGSAADLFDQGVALQQQQDYYAAVVQYQRAVAARVASPARAYFNTAACLRALGYPEKCLEALEIAVKLAPTDKDCRHWREKITRQLSEQRAVGPDVLSRRDGRNIQS
jgi:hypothetical protein